MGPKQRDMLERLASGPKLCGVWDFSGSRVPLMLWKAGLIKKCGHPTVKDRMGYPADAYALTEAGEKAAKEG